MLRRPTITELTALAERQSSQPVSYQDVELALADAGAVSDPPPGFHRLEVGRRIGKGSEPFDAAKAAITAWAGHRTAGAILAPEQPELAVDNVMALALRIWPLWVTASCRIVEVIDEPHRFGFSYGTLPHHPASGEERFLVIHDPATDEVRLEIVAVSRPASPLARAAGPIGRIVQRLTASRYLDGFESGPPAGAPRKATTLSPTSWRWWFENRNTGDVTVAQFPNWPLFAIGAATVVQQLAQSGSQLARGSDWAVTGLWLYWGGDELLRGVNPWRKLLGALVIGWRVLRLLT